MDESRVELIVFFEEPFWVGVFQRICGGRLSACKCTFGVEPRDFEIREFILKNYADLHFSPAVEAKVQKGIANPKRLQREIHRQSAGSFGIGTKSQQVLQMQREANKMERKSASKLRREAEAERRFAQKQQKRKEKHRGR